MKIMVNLLQKIRNEINYRRMKRRWNKPANCIDLYAATTRRVYK